VLLWAACQDLGKSPIDGDPLPCGTGRHVDERQDVQLILIWSREARQLDAKATLFRLTREVKRHQSHDPFGCSLLTEPLSTVERVKPGVGDRVCIADTG